MNESRRRCVVMLAAFLPTVFACRSPAGTTRAGGPAEVTAVSGPSWLHHLGLSIDVTRMGRMGGTSAPGTTAGEAASPLGTDQGPLSGAIRQYYSAIGRSKEQSAAMNQPFEVTGRDLYRLNCQSCHGPDGGGAPPEINSVIGPVQATSPALMEERMKRMGRPIDLAFAKELTAGAEQSLRDRLAHGGNKMPAFRHLQGAEVSAVLDYLKRLAGVPASGPALTVTESASRMGEHLVKGTCHICHDATGPGSGHMMMMSGVIPSLASFPEQKSVDDVISKVLRGGSGMSMMSRSRMPVLAYLTEPEVAAAYLYLAAHPPSR